MICLVNFSYFITEIFPDLEILCKNHDIEIEYVDSFYNISKEDVENNKLILANLDSIDSDRTFFICFRGQRLGWVPCENDVDKLTLEVYPELVKYIGTISISELSSLHALKPFDKYESGKLIKLPPVKHSLFYFRNPSYLKNLNDYEKLYYTNSIMGENAEVPDMNIAKAKDLIYEIKEEFDSNSDIDAQIIIRHYDGIWDEDLSRYDVLDKYIRAYSEIRGLEYDDLMSQFGNIFNEEDVGCFKGFECENKSLKDVILEDFENALKIEFPENFN